MGKSGVRHVGEMGAVGGEIKDLTRRRVPDPAEPVVRAGDEEGAVAVEVDGGHGV